MLDKYDPKLDKFDPWLQVKRYDRWNGVGFPLK